jgi:hypothetical protein
MAALYAIETMIRGSSPETRVAIRQAQSKAAGRAAERPGFSSSSCATRGVSGIRLAKIFRYCVPHKRVASRWQLSMALSEPFPPTAAQAVARTDFFGLARARTWVLR